MIDIRDDDTPHLFEPSADGHRMQYVRRILEQIPVTREVHLSTLPESMDHPAFLDVCRLAGKRLVVHPLLGLERLQSFARGRSGYAQQTAQWLLFRKHWRALGSAHRGTHVIVPFLDNISYAVGLLGSPFGVTPFQGILMRPSFHWQEMGVRAPASSQAWLQRALFRSLLRHTRLHALVTIDPSLMDWCTRTRPVGFDRVRYLEDPSDMAGVGGRPEALARFGLKDDDQVILVYGGIDERKGLRGLVRYASQPEHRLLVVLAVGRQSDRARAILGQFKASGGRLVEIDRYVDSQEEWLAFQAATWVWIAYEGFYGPSGVLAQAAQAGKPVIHNGMGLIDYLRKSRSLSRPDDIMIESRSERDFQ